MIRITGKGVSHPGILKNIPQISGSGNNSRGGGFAAQNGGTRRGRRAAAAVLFDDFKKRLDDRGAGGRRALHGDGVSPPGVEPVLGVSPAIKDRNTGSPITVKLVDTFRGGGRTGGGAIIHRGALDPGTGGAGISVVNTLGKSGRKVKEKKKEARKNKTEDLGFQMWETRFQRWTG